MTDRPARELGSGAVRTAVIWDAVRNALLALRADEPLDVVDLGGGTGGIAVRIAELGHRVVVVDPSPDALASLHRRAVERGVDDRLRGVQGDATDLSDHVADSSAHVVLCHGVLEVVDDPDVALAAIHRALRPGGVVSVVVAGRLAAVLARALAGDFTGAQHLLKLSVAQWDVRTDGWRRFTSAEADRLLQAHGFNVQRLDAVRVFSDLVPSTLVDAEPGARQELLRLERTVASGGEFAAVASQLHLIARA